MAQLAIETYQVCLGTGTNDPSPNVFVQGIRTYEDALQVRDRLTEMLTGGRLEYSSSLLFYVRQTPGTQSLSIAAQTPASVRQALAAVPNTAVVLYVRTADDAGQNQQYLRVGAFPPAILRQ